jgi:hypothetical protein
MASAEAATAQQKNNYNRFHRMSPFSVPRFISDQPMALGEVNAATVTANAPKQQNNETVDVSYGVKRYLVTGIRSLLDPQNPSAADFLLNPLKTLLQNEYTYASLTNSLARCLWYSRLDHAFADAINRLILRLANFIRDGTVESSKRMSDLLGAENQTAFPHVNFDFSVIEKDVREGFFRAFNTILDQHIQMTRARHNMEAFEGRYPLWKRCCAWIGAIIATLLAYPTVLCFPYFILGKFGNLREDLVILDMCKMYHRT